MSNGQIATQSHKSRKTKSNRKKLHDDMTNDGDSYQRSFESDYTKVFDRTSFLESKLLNLRTDPTVPAIKENSIRFANA